MRTQALRPRKCTCLYVVILMAMAALSGAAPDARHSFQTPLDDSVALDAAIASPQSVLGFEIGQKAVRYEALVKYLHELAAASARVSLAPYGTTHEGRTLYYLTITGETNRRKLDEIKAISAKLADPRTLTEADSIDKTLDTLPAVAWLAYNIHGDELSSTDAAVYIAYRLAAGKDRQTENLLENIVIHIDPLQNPDGRERYLSQIEQLSGVVENPDYQAMQHAGLWSRGRGNHYLFDLNRDWLTMAHPETQGRAAVILSWNPHLLVDSHEMGPMETYLFDPPSDPVNLHLGPHNMSWRRRFSQDQAAAFNRFGWSYYTGEWYTDWGPFYTNAWANLLGATGILYEQARANAAVVKKPTGQVMTFRETVHHHIVSSFANLRTLAANRRAILADFLADRRWAVSGQGHTCKGTFLLPPAPDKTVRQDLIRVLRAQGIEGEFAAEPLKAHGVVDTWGKRAEALELPAGTLIARSNQPHRRMLHTLLEFDPHLDEKNLAYERSELENHRGTHLYDVSSWSLALAYGLEAFWADDLQPVKADSTPPEADASAPIRTGAYGYVIDFADRAVYPALARLFENSCHVRIATRPFTMDGRSFAAGAIVLRKHENPDSLRTALTDIAKAHPIAVMAVDTALVAEGPGLGGPRMELLHEPRVAIASQWPVSSGSFGSAWYLLDHGVGLRTSPVNIQNIDRIDLRKYNVLILPEASNLAAVLDAAAVTKVRRWVEGGGTLIALGASAAFVADKDRGLSAVRRRRDVLDKIAVYAEALQREKDARTIHIDPQRIWGQPVNGDTREKKNEPAAKPEAGDLDKLKREDDWKRLFSPTGVFVKAVLNPEHWLAFGMPEELPVLFSGRTVFMSAHPVAAPVRLGDADELRLSGLLWPEAKERMAGSAYATVEKLGHGQVILFAADPTYRAWLAGSERLFLNAVLLGPGIGTSPPIPW